MSQKEKRWHHAYNEQLYQYSGNYWIIFYWVFYVFISVSGISGIGLLEATAAKIGYQAIVA